MAVAWVIRLSNGGKSRATAPDPAHIPDARRAAMARKSPPKSRARPPRKVRATPPPDLPGPPLIVPAHLALREPPHAHAVCHKCGRISEVPLSGLDIALLTDLAATSPEAWAVEGISLSLTGLCPRCRRGVEAPADSAPA